LRARYYNPVVGRFLQEDTYRGDGLNLYAYCANNPVMYYDPSGYSFLGKLKEWCKKLAEAFMGDTPVGEIIDESGSNTGLVPYYPANNGAIKGAEEYIHLREIIDRNGKTTGKYFAPVGTSIEMRALPHGTDLSNYHQYEVIKPFEV